MNSISSNRPKHELRGAAQERDIVHLLHDHPSHLGMAVRVSAQVFLAEKRRWVRERAHRLLAVS
jgi:hypothetical protein